MAGKVVDETSILPLQLANKMGIFGICFSLKADKFKRQKMFRQNE